MNAPSKTVVIYVVAFILLISWAYFVQADTRRVEGTSMLPTFEQGDLVAIQPVSIRDVHVGDIVVYNGLCSVSGLSVIHRVVQVTTTQGEEGLITKGDNNAQTDQYFHEIALGPITQQCLEGKVVFVIPYVELLAYYVDYYGLPQWVNYIPSVLILILVFISLLGEEKEKPDQSSDGAGNRVEGGRETPGRAGSA